MPIYLECPHCDHPQVVPSYRRGKATFCRQCGRAYRTSKDANGVMPLEISSMSELNQRIRGRQPVVLLNAG